MIVADKYTAAEMLVGERVLWLVDTFDDDVSGEQTDFGGETSCCSLHSNLFEFNRQSNIKYVKDNMLQHM